MKISINVMRILKRPQKGKNKKKKLGSFRKNNVPEFKKDTPLFDMLESKDIEEAEDAFQRIHSIRESLSEEKMKNLKKLCHSNKKEFSYAARLMKVSPGDLEIIVDNY